MSPASLCTEARGEITPGEQANERGFSLKSRVAMERSFNQTGKRQTVISFIRWLDHGPPASSQSTYYAQGPGVSAGREVPGHTVLGVVPITQAQTGLAWRTVWGLGRSSPRLEGGSRALRGLEGGEPAPGWARWGVACVEGAPETRDGGRHSQPRKRRREGVARCPDRCGLRRVLGLRLHTAEAPGSVESRAQAAP